MSSGCCVKFTNLSCVVDRRSSACHWLAPESLCHYKEVRSDALSPLEPLPPTVEVSCDHNCRLRTDHTVTSPAQCESRHHRRKSPRQRVTGGPFKSTQILPPWWGARNRREAEKEEESSDKQQQRVSQRHILTDSAVYCGVLRHRSHCGSENLLFNATATLGSVLTSSGRTGELQHVRSFRHPRADPTQRAAPPARPGWAVQPGAPAGGRTRRRGEPPEARTEGSETGSDRSDQKR
ncbi:hypothetical protein GOODEAATRI_009179 [Goodea atripinnis]|uniref:Uncharacterized protein n=1 Tax=Goodea atripinnis TaxID=208336 RepID=A0ABV0P2N4_9TELE